MTTMLLRVEKVYCQCGLLVGLPYVSGGGHNPSFLPSLVVNGQQVIGAPGSGIDCSSGASIGLRAGGMLGSPRPTLPLDTEEFLNWGEAGPGQWMTIHVIQNLAEQHMAIEFNLATPPSFYSNRWWQAANPRDGVGWFQLSDAEIAASVSRHWPGT